MWPARLPRRLLQKLPSCSEYMTRGPKRTFFQIPKINKQKEFAERKIVGYTMQQMFEVVSQVDHYQEFLPWCKKSVVTSRGPEFLKADLMVGFPPVSESYTSFVTFKKPYFIKAECQDFKLFKYMISVWKFGPGLPENDKTCVIDFYVTFEFKSALHSKLATVFFDEVVRKMANAFLKQATVRYGKESVPPKKLLSYSS